MKEQLKYSDNIDIEIVVLETPHAVIVMDTFD